MQKMTFFLFQLGMGYGVRKMTARVWRVFLLLRSTFPDPYPSRYGSLCGSKWPKINKIFCFRLWNMGCPIEWANDGDHLWYWDRLVNSAISGLKRADRPRIIGNLVPFYSKYCLLPKGEKIGPRRPNEPLAGHGASGPIFSTARAFVPVSLRPLKN